MADIDTSYLDADTDKVKPTRVALYQAIQRVNDLASAASASKGSGLVAFDATLNYAAGTIGARLGEDVSVRDFPWCATGDGTTDDTSAIAAAVTWCRANGRRLRFPRPPVRYKVTAPIVLASDMLAPVSVIGESPQWYGDETVIVEGDFDGAIFQASGTAGGYCVAPYIGNLTLRNRSTGASACAIRSDYSGGLRVEHTRIQARNFGVYSASEMISPVFIEVCIDTDAGAPNGTGKAGYKLAARNCRIYGGRVYAQEICYDYTGDILFVSGANCEFSQVIFRHGPLASAVFDGCHFETSQVLVTNAIDVPISFAGAWADNASSGAGISGSVAFVGGTCFFSGGAYGARSNLAVIKGAGGFSYRLSIDGMAFSHPNPIVGNSFAPGASVALPSGTKVRTAFTDGPIVAVPPTDAFSGFETDAANGQRYFDKVRVNQFRCGQVTQAAVASGGSVDISTGLGEFATAVYEVAWRAAAGGYEYGAVVQAVQSYNVFKFDTILSAAGAGSADAHWTVTNPSPGVIRITNASGGAKDVTVNFQIKHQLT